MGGSRFYISHDKAAGYFTVHCGILLCSVVHCTVHSAVERNETNYIKFLESAVH